MPDSVLFRVQEVEVPLSEFDLPGPTHREVLCMRCGQVIRDQREVMVDGVTLCKPCAHGAYFKNARETAWENMNWAPTLCGTGEKGISEKFEERGGSLLRLIIHEGTEKHAPHALEKRDMI
jgi:formylmethanofuran dehydrogenase subunit E